MPQRLPKTLIAALALAAFTSLAFSVYMEQYHLNMLQDHPVLTNLLSGLTGFSFASLAVAVGFSWFVAKEKIKSLHRKGFRQQWDRAMRDRNAAIGYLQVVHSDNRYSSPQIMANAMEATRLLDGLIKLQKKIMTERSVENQKKALAETV